VHAVARSCRFPVAQVVFAFVLSGCGSRGTAADSGDGGPAPLADAGPEAGADGAPNSDDGPGDEGYDPQAIVGVVVDFSTSRPLAGRRVSVSGRRTTTNQDGAFTVPAAPSIYDVVVVDPDGLSASIYRGLSRRDPVLGHTPSSVPDATARSSLVAGNLSGGGSYPLGATDSVSVYFFSAPADGSELLGGSLAVARGPSYGPIHLLWNGPSSVAGRLVAIGSFGGDRGSWALADRDVTVGDGVPFMQDLALVEVAQTGIGGAVAVPSGHGVGFVQVGYRLPIPNAIIGLVDDQRPQAPFQYSVPDLTALGASLCVSAVGDTGFFLTMRCGLAPGATDAALTLEAPPSLLEPNARDLVQPSTVFSWTPFAGGVHVLSLDADPPTARTPSLRVFTAATQAPWPDLSSFGIPFPASAAYQCTVGGLGPYGTMDDAFGPGGVSALVPAETQRSYSAQVALTTAP
jgi:hypothetical protein